MNTIEIIPARFKSGTGAEFYLLLKEQFGTRSLYIQSDPRNSVYIGTFDTDESAFEAIELIATGFAFMNYQVELSDEYKELM